MATTIDISRLARNDAMRPFHVAAGISVWGDRQALSEDEALLHSIHEARPDTDILDMASARNFLGTLDANRSDAVQRRANNLFGVARLLTEGSTERLPGRDWKMEGVEISSSLYREAYYENRQLSYNDLKGKVIAETKAMRTREWQRETSWKIDKKVSGKTDVASTPLFLSIFGAIVGVCLATATAVCSAPLWATAGLGVGSFGLLTGWGIGIGGIEALEEIDIPFFS